MSKLSYTSERIEQCVDTEGKLNLLTTYVPVPMIENAYAKLNKLCSMLSNS